MNRPLSKMAVSAGVVLAGAALLAGIAGPASAAGASSARHHRHHSKVWSFGVMADTQWTNPPGDDGKNPNTVAVDIINQLNQQFVASHVKFVVQAGDLVDKQSTASLDTTAAFRQALYNAGIGFYPLRGNHENSAASALEFLRVFPQTTTAQMNGTPADAFVAANVDPAQPAPTPSGTPFTVGKVSSAPAAPTGFTGLDYAFDYGNARFVFLDQFTPTTGTAHASLDQSQIDWMKGQLAGRKGGTHAFVFGHKGIITENHVDTLFTDDKNLGPAGAPTLSNAFIQDLQANGVRYYMGGHDHMHNRALVKSVDGKSQVEDITLASDSSKFYIPYGAAGYDQRAYDPVTKKVAPTGTALAAADPTQTNDYLFNVTVAGGTTRETEISQDLYKIGYYIFTVNGPRVSVDYYAADPSAFLVAAEGEYQIATTPTLVFKKTETFGYSLNGKEFQVPEGTAYTGVKDSFDGTDAAIIAGTNASTATDAAGRALTKTVDTGWSKAGRRDDLSSSVLTLWGLTDLGAKSTDTYVLSMSYGSRQHRGEHGGPGTLVTRTRRGWVNAVAANHGGKAKFVLGPYKSGYGLGTYGIDLKSRTAWAVVDHEGSFAVSKHIAR